MILPSIYFGALSANGQLDLILIEGITLNLALYLFLLEFKILLYNLAITGLLELQTSSNSIALSLSSP